MTIVIKQLDPTAFKAISHQWNAFLKRSTNDNIFLTFEWLSAWWEAFQSPARTFFMLIAYDGEENILGGFPLQIVRHHHAFLPKVTFIQFIGRGVFDAHLTEYNTFMMPPVLPGHEQGVYAAVTRFLDTLKYRWDVIVLANLESTHPSIDCLERELSKRFKSNRTEQENNYVIQLSATYEIFLKGLSRNQRRNFKRRTKRIAEEYDASYAVIDQEAQIDDYLVHYYALVQKRHHWRPTRQKEDFLQTLCRRLARSKTLRCYLLSLNGIPAATIFGFWYNRKYYAYKAAINTDFFALSPGTALYAFAIRNEIENGIEELDYLLGEYAYKHYWCNQVRQIEYIQITNKHPVSRFKLLLWKSVTAFMRIASKITNLQQRLILKVTHRHR
jgi:CelD/BcsL family acetyltransferase involved in cellulose biosynthesis